jgi:5-methylthioadenosine/S-adenosylhomocysteine deaminase
MSTATQTADTLIHPGWIVPVVPRGTVLENYSIAISDSRISALLPRNEAGAISADRELELPGHALMPGLVNCHGHAATSGRQKWLTWARISCATVPSWRSQR